MSDWAVLLLNIIWIAALFWLSRNPEAKNWAEVRNLISALGAIPDIDF